MFKRKVLSVFLITVLLLSSLAMSANAAQLEGIPNMDSLKITGVSSASSAVVGNKVTITANASGGAGDYTYSFLIHTTDTNEWYRFSDFSALNSLTWTASIVGDSEFYVEVKDGSGTVVQSNAITVNVVE